MTTEKDNIYDRPLSNKIFYSGFYVTGAVTAILLGAVLIKDSNKNFNKALAISAIATFVCLVGAELTAV